MGENNNDQNKEGKNEFATEADEIAAMQVDAPAENAQAETFVADGDPIEILRKQLESLTSDLQRERAEFSNFRKRAQSEKLQQAAQTSARLLTDLLPALDALDQFFSAYAPKAESDAAIKGIVDGVQMVQKQISRVFTEAGVEEFSPIGEEFNPTLMEALSQHEAEVEHETVTQVYQKGYRIEGRVIRPARVVVAKPKTGGGDPS
jgi:molecular chaperone GrpE